MSGLNRFTSLIIGLLLTVLLLSAEYWLLLNKDKARELDRQQHWGELSSELLALRLQEALDHSVLLAQSLSRQLSGRDSTLQLADLAQTVLKDDSIYDGLAIVRKIEPTQRQPFETAMANSIRTLKNHHLTASPEQPLYYPVESYLPDDANALPQGLDLGSIGDARRKMDQARNRRVPIFMFNVLPSNNGMRLDIITSLSNDGRMLLMNLRNDKLVQSGNTAPDQTNPLQYVRLVAWAQDIPSMPFLDTHPSQPLPSDNPLFTVKRTIGGSDLLFGVYPLELEHSTLNTQDYIILLISSFVMGSLLLLHQRQLNTNYGLRNLLKRQHQQLEQTNLNLQAQIADRTSSEQALAQSEARQRAILQASSDPIVLIDRAGLITDANPAAMALIEEDSRTILQMPIGSLLSELYSFNGAKSFDQIANERAGLPFEAKLLRKNDTPLTLELSLSRVNMPDDFFYVAVCRDISARKAQEADLIRLKNSLAEQVEVQNRQFAALLDASPMAMAYIVDRKLKQVNRSFLDLFERKESDVLDHSTMPYFVDREQWERTGKALYNLLNDGKVVQAEVKLRTGSGRIFWCRLSGKAVKPSVPKLGTIWLYQDFSADRELEDTLRHAKILAEDSNRAKTEFLANMSHELRTPLHAILGFTDIGVAKARHLQDERIGQYFEKINASGNRLLSLLNDLLDIAKMDVGKMEYQFARYDLMQCLNEACDELTPIAAKNGIAIHLHYSTDSILATFDALRIGQVIRNLLSNAIKFSPAHGSIWVTGSVREYGDQEEVLVTVEDSGPGIPTDELEAIFDKFTQSSTTKTGAGGTGLGLAICKEIILAHKGQISARNAPEQGAIFSFSFPRDVRIIHTEDQRNVT